MAFLGVILLGPQNNNKLKLCYPCLRKVGDNSQNRLRQANILKEHASFAQKEKERGKYYNMISLRTNNWKLLQNEKRKELRTKKTMPRISLS